MLIPLESQLNFPDRPFARSGFGAELGQEGFGCRLGVEDVGGGEPGAAELGDAEAHLVELCGGVGVGVDDDFAAELFGEAEVEVVEVGAGGAGVVFDGDAEFGGAFEDAGDVDGVGFAARGPCGRWGGRGCGCGDSPGRGGCGRSSPRRAG